MTVKFSMTLQAIEANPRVVDRALDCSYTADAPKARHVELKFVPYYPWANRAATPMQFGRRSARRRKPE